MNNKRDKILLIGDGILIIFALYASHLMRYGVLEPFISNYSSVTIILYIATIMFSSFVMELYNYEASTTMIMIAIRVAIVAVLSFFILSAIFYIIPEIRVYRGRHALFFALFGACQLFLRFAVVRFLDTAAFAKKVLIVGTGPVASKIGALIENTNHQHTLAGYIQCSPLDIFVPSGAIISSDGDIVSIVKAHGAHKIVVSLSERRGTLPINNILACKLQGIEVIDAPSFYEQMTGKLLIEAITPSWFIFSDGFKLTRLKLLAKNSIDKVFAIIAVIISFPLMPIIALAIKMDSRGPIFYRQIRVGRGNRLISIYKFRSMREDAESDSGVVWALKGDDRVTRVGKLLRKTRLDELPQIINVLKGEMSFIGPRPERPEFVGKLREIIPYYAERHVVKPGITGWAQVKYPYGASVEDAIEKLRFDLYYIKNLSFMLDLYILLETVKVVIFGKGSR